MKPLLYTRTYISVGYRLKIDVGIISISAIILIFLMIFYYLSAYTLHTLRIGTLSNNYTKKSIQIGHKH